jgi:hypothetical protein
MFRVMSSPIIRSTWLYLQLLVLSTDVAVGWCHGWDETRFHLIVIYNYTNDALIHDCQELPTIFFCRLFLLMTWWRNWMQKFCLKHVVYYLCSSCVFLLSAIVTLRYWNLLLLAMCSKHRSRMLCRSSIVWFIWWKLFDWTPSGELEGEVPWRMNWLSI